MDALGLQPKSRTSGRLQTTPGEESPADRVKGNSKQPIQPASSVALVTPIPTFRRLFDSFDEQMAARLDLSHIVSKATETGGGVEDYQYAWVITARVPPGAYQWIGPHAVVRHAVTSEVEWGIGD
ncbi:hypothetical protein N7517_008026 [Penicillium concentricum]|uniref:Uncharacterized protein n=1 Tax=Penicillium concentricum TaxID=293559 RepID=A0A9W9V3H1_9EURO|nr:uncharacterized protein N7517_008026 [Penicillium concentricum]KAJ5365140.1 hypothetical protein N7517_008026 [Penicillium concentricum]